MSILLDISYDCAAKETLFLGSGWGIRDVRGPYLIGEVGLVKIPKCLLSARHITEIDITFSLSNRSPHEGVEVKLRVGDYSTLSTLERNKDTTIHFAVGSPHLDGSLNVEVSATGLTIGRHESVIEPIVDYVALDRIIMHRNHFDRIRY